MVKLDRVEMFRESSRESRTIPSPEEEQSVPIGIQKLKQTEAVRDRLSALRDGDISDQRDENREDAIGSKTAHVEESREETRDDAQESRQDVPVTANDPEEVFIEAEFETVLESDFILTTRKTPVEEDEKEEEEQPTITLSLTDHSLTPNDESVTDCGIEVQWISQQDTETDSSSANDVQAKEQEEEVKEAKEEAKEETEKKDRSDESTKQEACYEVEDLWATTAITNDDATQASNLDVHPSLPSVDATWSFDTTLKRRKVDKVKSKIAKNVFMGFEEEDENNVADNNDSEIHAFTGFTEENVNNKPNGEVKDVAMMMEKMQFESTEALEEDSICQGEDMQPVADDTATDDFNQMTEVAESTDNISDVSSSEDKDTVDAEQDEAEEAMSEMEEPQVVDNAKATDDHKQIIDVDESTDEGAENAEVVEADQGAAESESMEADQGAVESESMEFDDILENIAEQIENSDWDAFIKAVTTRPSLATLSSVDFFPSECTGFLAVGASENLLLHEVCKNEPSAEAVTTLIEVHDAAVKTAGQWGYLPIHCACASGASEGVIRALLKAHPESIETFGDDKMFPLHHACKRGAPMGIFELLLEAYPSASAGKDVYDKTPMDYVLSQVEGPERAKKLELLGRQAQTMFLSTAGIETTLRRSEEKASYIRMELSEKRERVLVLESDLKELYDKTLSLEGALKEKQERSSDLGESLKVNQERMADLETELGVERAKASVFGENLKKELAKSCTLEMELRDERTKSSNLKIELKTNCEEWSALGAEMEEEFLKSSAEMTKERTTIAELERKLKDEREKCSIIEGKLQNRRDESSCLDTFLNNERVNIVAIQDKLAAAKLRWLIEKQKIHENNHSNLSQAYQVLKDFGVDATSHELWLVKRNEMIEKNDVQMTAAYEVVQEIESELDDKHTKSIVERQAIYEKVEHQLIEAYKIICKAENDMKEERSKWLVERQIILEKNNQNMAEAFMTMRETDMSLAAKKFQLEEYEGVLNERKNEIEREHDKSKTLLRQLELAKEISGEKLAGLVEELNLQKSFSQNQTKQIDALESSIELKLTDVNDYVKHQQDTLAYESSMADDIMKKINEKKKLMQENHDIISVLEKSNLMKQELLEVQQKKVEALEVGRREKENQLKLNQRAMKQLEESIAKKQALEKEETSLASRLAGTRASRKAAIDIEEDQIKELDYTLARKQALIELETMKEKTLQQTIAQKHELIESEVARIKELELLIAEKRMHITTERNTMKELTKAKAEKDALLVSEQNVVSELQKTQEEKERIIEVQKETEALIQSDIKKEEALRAFKHAAIEGVKEARATLEAELKTQRFTTVALENQIARKRSLITKEAYVAKCLQHMSLHKREFMPPGAISYFVNAYFGMQHTADSGMKFLLKETHLASDFVKTHIREQSAAVRKKVSKRRDEVLALVPAVSVPGLGICKTVVSKGPRSLMARLMSFGVNVDLFPKGYSGSTSPGKKKTPTPESKLPKWNKNESE